ncbi:tyrosine kinase receptor Cad96Ca-like [Ptychodera flava]|uniref:tyrosine kinase receptor Cad96Ca-like n=1 Tax=Ptychodera flava TaxID=63121 RepID=UPI003969DAB2
MPGEIVLEFPKEYVRQKDLIGEGTFGRVFKAEAWELCDRDGVTVVALKTIKDNAPEDDKQKLTDELELLKTIASTRTSYPWWILYQDSMRFMFQMRLPVRWMAPEALWSSEFSVESDIWSFGVVVWEIVTLGNTPYPGMSAKEVIEYLKQGSRMVRPNYCNEDLYLLMMNCWSQKPTRRPKFKDLVHELEEMECDTEVIAY